jgi:hypothetical protein
MAESRQTRETQTRSSGDRPKNNWTPPNVLPEVKDRDGWTHHWVRTSLVGKADNTNVSSRFREGWEAAPRNEYSELHVLLDRDSRFPDNIEIGGLLLCRAPKEIMDARNEYYQKKTQDNMTAVDNNLMKENDPRMPLFKDSKSSISFGRGVK